MENNQNAARAAKRFLDERTRTDWAYPNTPPPWDASDEEVRDAVDFCERYYGESESSDEDIEPTTGAAKDAYKFEGPDSIGDAVGAVRERRRKRRRERLEEEMAENEGLRIWVSRRDAWTGASSVRKYGTARTKPRPPPSTPPQHDSGTGSTPDSDTNTPDLVPLAAPLLPSNPIRASITPQAYPDIYAKIVTSSRTPSVPINLSDMTQALVQGWKDTNEWPPKVGALDPLAGRKRGIAGVLGREGVLGVVGGGRDGGVGVVGGGREGESGSGGFIHRHPHLEKGVGSVKKILHLSGHAHAHAQGGHEEGREG